MSANSTALKSKSSEEILQQFLNFWVSFAGLPFLLICDNELGLAKGIFKDFCTQHNVQIKHSLPYSPQGNSYAEITVKLVKSSLRSFCMDHNCIRNWHQYLWLITNQNNALVSRSMETSPELLMFRHSNLNLKTHPLVLLHNRNKLPNGFSEEIAQLAEKTVADFIKADPTLSSDISLTFPSNPKDTWKVIEHVNQTRDKVRKQNKEQKDKHRMPSTFQVGYLVLKRKLAIAETTAMKSRYGGPWVIIKIATKIAWIRHCIQGNVAITNVDHIKPYYENHTDYHMPSSWLKDVKTLIK